MKRTILILCMILLNGFCFSKDIDRILEEVNQFLEKGDYKSAEKLLTDALLTDSLNGKLYLYLGNVYYTSQDLEKSLASFNRALELKPNNPRILIDRGKLKREMKDFRGALADFNRVIYINPLHRDALYERAMLYKERENYEAALVDLHKLIQIDSTKYSPKWQVASIKKKQGKLWESLADYSALCIEFPNKYVAWNNLADTEMQLKDYECALEHIEKSISVNPKYANAYITRGEIRLKMNDSKQACQDFNKAIELGEGKTKEEAEGYLVKCK